jgi:hypothetical protein
MMTGNNRADAVYAVVSAQQNFTLLSDDEKKTVQANLRIVFGADLAYVVGNAQVNPGSLTDPAGAAVSTTGSPAAQTGFVTSATKITGLGTLS